MSGLVVVGIGTDGWAGLAEPSRSAVSSAEVVLGGARHLAMLPDSVSAVRIGWPSPLLPALPGLLEEHRDRAVCVLASGDPMFHGIGTTLVRLVGPDRVRVLPHPSSASLAAARLGWPLASSPTVAARSGSSASVSVRGGSSASVSARGGSPAGGSAGSASSSGRSPVDRAPEVVSLVNAPVSALLTVVNPGQRVLVLSAGADTPDSVASVLTAHGFGESVLTVLEQLGGPEERIYTGVAASWAHPKGDPLNIVAIECAGGPATSAMPGLPDSLYDSDGQLTKREIRAVTLSALAPIPGELLWDVGAGAGSVAIEWMRHHRSCHAIAVESAPERAARIIRNAAALGVPGLRVVEGRAPAALTDLPTPDAVFIGGGLTREGVVETCLAALPSGGRLVANAVTLESEAALASWFAKLGGEMSRIAVNRAAPVGGFTGWRAMMPVTTWSVTKP